MRNWHNWRIPSDAPLLDKQTTGGGIPPPVVFALWAVCAKFFCLTAKPCEKTEQSHSIYCCVIYILMGMCYISVNILTESAGDSL